MAANPYESLVEDNPYAGLVDAVPNNQIRTGVLTSQDDPGSLGAFMLSAGRRTDKIVEGAKDLVLRGKKRFLEARGDTAGAAAVQKEIDAIAAEQGESDTSFAPVQEARPLATSLGDVAPYSLPTGGIAPSALIGGLTGFTSYDPEMAGRLKAAGTQGALAGGGAAVGGVLSSVASPGQRVMQRNVLTSPFGDLMDRLRGFRNPDARGEILGNMEQRGYTPYLSEIGGSTTARQAEDYLSRAPGGSGVMADFAARNTRAVNTAAASSIGERARNLSAPVLDDASQNIGRTFEAVAKLPGRPIGLDPNVAQAAQEVLRLQSLRPISQDPTLQRVAGQLQAVASNRGRITGEAYNALRSDLSAAANAAHRQGNSAVGRGFDALLEAVDGSAAASLQAAGQGELAGALVTARGQYGNLMSLERGRTVSAAGDVNPQALSGVMRQKYPRAFREGRMEGNPLFDIARYGETYPPLRTGSQTFERQAIQDMAEAPAAMATGAERAGPSLMGVATMPFNWLGAQYATSPVARFLSRRGVLGMPTFSHTGGVLSDVVARDLVNGMPGSVGVLNAENWE